MVPSVDACLFFSKKGLYPVGQGGGEISAHLLLDALARQGVAVEAHGALNWSHKDELLGAIKAAGLKPAVDETKGRRAVTYQAPYPVRLHDLADFGASCQERLSEPDRAVVLLQAEGWPELVSPVKRSGRGCVVFIHNAAEIEAIVPDQEASIDVLAAPSAYLAELLREKTGRPVMIVPAPIARPIMNIETEPATRPFITFINPIEIKGRDVFFALARDMLDEKFLVVENWGVHPLTRRVLAAYPNVTSWPRQTDMTLVWEQTRLLIVPSQVPEAFGRVAAEAQVEGIPVVANRLGGLIEAVGDGGLLVDDFSDPGAWVRAISRVINDRDLYQELSAKARCHPDRFEPASVADCFRRELAPLLVLGEKSRKGP
ncbi:MAG: glycosyltransferase [Proteobacteria bacterium]|nr:glycosyltransferase [Pseudomonadota bacterium]